MTSHDGRWTVVYNGEIYNYPLLRDPLASQGVRFRGTSDTEIFLEVVSRVGPVEAIRRCDGMFAIALFDQRERQLFLARDRIGEKPLYWGVFAGSLVFGSELKALRANPAFDSCVDRAALVSLLDRGYIAGPRSIYEGVSKLRPGTILAFGSPTAPPRETVYWSAPSAARELGQPDDGVEGLDRLLRETVRREMVSDVPLGAFLSGGVDSSLIVAMMQASSESPVRTFTIGFREPEYDEAPFACAVAEHLGTEHTELYIGPDETLAMVPTLSAVYDEPFADASTVPTLLVCSLARQHVTVALSGDGGDELFGGYDRYSQSLRLGGLRKVLPRPVRHALATGIRSISAGTWDALLGGLAGGVGGRLGVRVNGDRLHKLAGALPAASALETYERLVRQWPEADRVVLGAVPVPAVPVAGNPPADDRAHMMLLDLVGYLPDDILVKTDRAAMSVSLETRAPFLDHHVVEAAWRLPMTEKFGNGTGKLALRRLLARYLPPRLVERPKKGFSVPIDHWLRGPLRTWAGDLLEAGRLRRQGYLDADAVARKWQEHQSGARNWQHQIWAVLMFQSWLDAR